MVRESEFKSEVPEFDPLAEQGEGRCFCPSQSTLVQTLVPNFQCIALGQENYLTPLYKEGSNLVMP